MYWIDESAHIGGQRQITFMMDSDADVSLLPKYGVNGTKQGKDIISCLPCGKGSSAFSIASGKTYILDSNNNWVEIVGMSSGGETASVLEPIF